MMYAKWLNNRTSKNYLKKCALLLVAVLMFGWFYPTNVFAAEKLICEKDGVVDDSFVVQGNSELSKVPDQIRERLARDGWKFAITTKNLAATYYPGGGYSSIAGITVPNEKVIYAEDRRKAIWRATIHEIGHAVDFELAGEKGFISRQNEFTQIFNEEKNHFTDITAVGDGHEYSNQMEYFASAWCNYCLANSHLKEQAPKTYAYIEKEFSRYAGVPDASYFTYEALSGSVDPEFDANAYYANYEDLRAAFGMNKDALYNHFITYGKAEGRNAKSLLGTSSVHALIATE